MKNNSDNAPMPESCLASVSGIPRKTLQIMYSKKELLIHFNNVSICLDNIKYLGIKITPQCRNYIKLLHSSVMAVNQDLPENIVAEVCFRTANRIIKLVEMETDIRFVKYKLHNYKTR